VLGALLYIFKIGDGLCCAATFAAHIALSYAICILCMSMGIRTVNASMLISDSFLADAGLGCAHIIPAVVACRESDSSDGQDHDSDEYQSDGLFHCDFLLLFI
jgi:hypothetical protein